MKRYLFWIIALFVGTACFAQSMDLNAKPKHGTVIRAYLDEWPMCIYMPPGFWTDTRNYSTLYLLHGTGDNDMAWLEQGGASEILDKMYNEGELPPMIVVMPYVDASTDGTFEENFEKIVKFVEKHYDVDRNKRHRAIAGLSIGAFHAMHIAHHYPDMFNYVGLFSGMYTSEKMEIFNKDVDKLFCTDERVPEVFRHTEEELAKEFKRPPKLYFMAVGKNDFLYRQCVLYREFLDQHGYNYEYHESKGGHSWSNWHDYLEVFLPKLFK